MTRWAVSLKQAFVSSCEGGFAADCGSANATFQYEVASSSLLAIEAGERRLRGAGRIHAERGG